MIFSPLDDGTDFKCSIGQKVTNKGIHTLTDSHDIGLVCQGVTMVALHQIEDIYTHIKCS